MYGGIHKCTKDLIYNICQLYYKHQYYHLPYMAMACMISWYRQNAFHRNPHVSLPCQNAHCIAAPIRIEIVQD